MVRTSQRYVPVALFLIAIVLLAARVTVYALKRDAATAGSIVRWVTPDEAMQLAASSNKPLLYDFTAAWCKPCDVLDEEVFRNPAIASEINERFIAVRVVDRRQEDGVNSPQVDALEQQYSVRGFPTVVFADANGTERARMEGFRGRGEFERVMEQIR